MLKESGKYFFSGFRSRILCMEQAGILVPDCKTTEAHSFLTTDRKKRGWGQKKLFFLPNNDRRQLLLLLFL